MLPVPLLEGQSDSPSREPHLSTTISRFNSLTAILIAVHKSVHTPDRNTISVAHQSENIYSNLPTTSSKEHHHR